MMKIPLGTAQPNRDGGRRQSQPYQYPFGVIPRRLISSRGLDHRGHGEDRETFWKYGRENPLRLLSLLPDVHPSIGLALWNALRLTTCEGDTQIVAVKPGTPGKGEVVDNGGTAAIEALWESLPEEIGGLTGLMTQLIQQAMLTGLVCAEAVPASRMQGVYRVWPVDSLTIHFHRDFETTEVMPLQRQLLIKKPKETFQGYAVLSRDTFFWRSIDQQVDEPYGRAPFAPAVFECLADLAMIEDIRDAIHNAAWPRLGLGQNYTELYKIAHEIMGLQDNTGDYAATTWVNQRILEVQEAVGKLKAADNIIYDAAGKLDMVESRGAFGNMRPVIEFLRQRIVQSLKTLPTLMGINDGSTQTYTTVEWAIYAAGLESIRNVVVNVLCKCAQVHLRLLGLDLKAVGKVKPIRTTDGMIEAQGQSIQIGNLKQLVQLGWISNEEGAITATGSGPVADPMPGAYGLPAQPDPDDEKGSQPDETTGGKKKAKGKKSGENSDQDDPDDELEEGSKP